MEKENRTAIQIFIDWFDFEIENFGIPTPENIKKQAENISKIEIMNGYDIKRFALILAKQAELEGMKARNKEKNIDAKNPELPTYSEHAFIMKAEEIKAIAYMNDDQIEFKR